MCILLYVKLIQCSGGGMLGICALDLWCCIIGIRGGEWGTSALGICAFFYISKLIQCSGVA